MSFPPTRGRPSWTRRGLARCRAVVLVLLALAGSAGDLRAQNILSVPFTNGFLGTRGSSAGSANGVLTYATLGIARTFFIQSSSGSQFELQGNDIAGTLRIVRTNGTTLDIPAIVNWRMNSSGGNTDLIGILPTNASPITYTYAGGSIQITSGTSPGGTSVGGYLAGFAGTLATDGTDQSGNASKSQALSELNAYLATVIAQRPNGPVTVSALTTSSTTPTIGGTATIAAGENLSVVVGGVQYTTSSTPALAIVGTTWSLALTTPLALGTYPVTATITDADGFTLNDATTNELVIASAGGAVTIGGSFTANGRTYDGTTAATGTTTGLTLSGVSGGHTVTIASVTLAFQTTAAGVGRTVTITGVTLGGTHGALYTVNLAGAPTATATITAKPLTIGGLAASHRVYDGTVAATLTGTASYTGLVSGENLSVTGTPTATFGSAAVGTAKPVTVTGYTAPTTNYTVTQPTGLTANVTARPLTIAGLSGVDRAYDGGVAATLAGTASYVGLASGDNLSVTGTPAATFATAAVGNAKAVTVTGFTAPSANYTVSQPTGITASVTAKPLTIGGSFAVANRAFDGTTAATITTNGLTLVGVVGSESVSLTGVAATFATAAVGTAKPVSLTTASLTGAAAGNYTLSTLGAPTTTANITSAGGSVTLAGTFTANDRVYDATTAATGTTTGLSLVGVSGGDNVTIASVTLAFQTAAAGSARTVAVTAVTLGGTHGAQYAVDLTGAPTATASITAKPLTIGGLSASSRVYDGTFAATLTGTASYTGLVPGDNLSVTGTPTATFGSAAVGTAKAVTVTGYTAPNANYTVTQPTGLTADVTARPLTIAGVSAVDRVYDGGVAATLAGTAAYVGLASGDNLSVLGTPSATFATATVGTGKAVTVTGYQAPNGNYTVTQPAGLTASITAKPLTIGGSFAAASKGYDGTAAATIATNALTLVGVLGGDAVSLTGVAAAFADASVGTAKPVSLTSASLTGAAAGNYTLSTLGAPTTTASITSAGGTVTIAGTFTANGKTYDGTTAATGDASGLTLLGVTAPDQVTIASVALAFQSAAAGTGKTVVITGVTLGGADGARYGVSLASAPTATATIAPKALAIAGVSATDRPYDGTTTATLAGTASYTGLVSGESHAVAGTPTATFATATVGTAKPVTVTGYAAPNTNYTVAQPTGITASVTAKPLTIGGSFAVPDRTFDGTTAATIATNGLTLVGVVGGDVVSLTGVTAAFATAAVGTAKPVSLTAASLTGAAAGNYALGLLGAPTTTASITSAGGTVTLAGTFTASDRTYDGTTAATGVTTGLTLVGVTAPDQVTIASVTLAFQSATVGGARTVVITGVTLAGADAARYAPSLAGAPTATARIAPRLVTIGGAFSAADKLYDGNAAASITTSTLRLVGVVGSDAVSLGGVIVAFADAAVGAGKPVTLTNASLVGAAAGNYVLSTSGAPSTTASILPATPPSAPRNVTATPGDGTIAIGWAAPQAPGCREVTGYVVESSADGGRTWSRTSAGGTSATLGGLTNNVAYQLRVAAVNACGTGPFAGAGTVVPLAPTRDGAGQLPTGAPGSAAGTTGGVAEPVTTEVVQDTIVRVAGGDFALRLRATDAPGAAIPMDGARTLQLERGGAAATDGTGFAAGTVVTAYLYAPGAAPLLLGTTPVGADGAFVAAFPIPATLAAGDYTLQVNGVDRGMRTRAVALGVSVVLPPPDLVLDAAPDESSPIAGDTITITITVTNRGRGPATAVVIPRAFHEPGFTIVRTTPLEGTYDAATQAWSIARIESGARARMLLTVVVLHPATAPVP